MFKMKNKWHAAHAALFLAEQGEPCNGHGSTGARDGEQVKGYAKRALYSHARWRSGRCR